MGNLLRDYVSPVFGKLPIAAVDTALVMKVLEPIWATKPETARKLCRKIAKILDSARVRGLREGENPARWQGHLDQLLPARPNPARQASRGTSVHRASRLHGAPVGSIRDRRPRPRVHDLDGGTDGRGHRRTVA